MTGEQGTALQIATAVRRGERSAADAVEAALAVVDEREPELHAFNLVMADEARQAAAAIDAKVAAGEDPGPLAGVPIALKDNLCTRGIATTCSSKILEGWTPPYDATVVELLARAGAVVVGKTNLDEFAMGSSTENSAFGPTRNPHDTSRVPGGSSGGSAAAVAAGMVPVSLGSDTGGSIRQPAALCGVVGVKPTYGRVSRYGLVAFSSSFDQAGPFARTVMDAALLHQAIGGHDPYDSTSVDRPVPPVVAAAHRADVKGLRIGVVKELGGEGYQPGVEQRFREAVAILEGLGAEVVEVSCPSFDHAMPAYYLIAPSEASSNLARFDAMRYGLRVGEDEGLSAEQVMARTRAQGFGPEVKRRIMIGTYALSSGYYDAYYGQAQKVRTLITRDFEAAFAEVDVLVSPTTPTTAFPIGERSDDPLAMYLADLCTIPSNLAGNASMSVPAGLSPDDGLPVGFQIVAPPFADDRLYNVGAALEGALRDRWGGLLIERAPALEGVSA